MPLLLEPQQHLGCHKFMFPFGLWALRAMFACCFPPAGGCRFGPSDLLGETQGARVPLLLEPQQHRLAWSSSSLEALQQRAADTVFQQAAQAALQAAHKVSWVTR